jgi:hypothetical protein
VNANVIAMDTAAVTLAGLATGLIIAGRRGRPCWQKIDAGQLDLT